MLIGTLLFIKEPDYSMAKLAGMIGVSLSQVCRIRNGQRKVSNSFIAGVLTAFPQYKFEELFFIKK